MTEVVNTEIDLRPPRKLLKNKMRVVVRVEEVQVCLKQKLLSKFNEFYAESSPGKLLNK